MNLYTSSIRLCFLLFESMRIHLKFQLEVTVFGWDWGCLLRVHAEALCVGV